MKKFIVIFCLFFFAQTAFADTEIYSTKEVIRRRQMVQKVGYQILNTNRIDKRMTFEYNHYKKEVNAYSRQSDRHIIVTKGMMNMIDSEDELAAVLGHEISHSIDSYRGIFRGFFNFNLWLPGVRRAENKADMRAVDFVANAGYNPVATIIIYNKIMSQYRYEWLTTHPISSRRLMRVYERIYKKYPYFLVNNEYIKNPVYQNFLLTSQENRLLLKNAIEQEKITGKFKQPHYN